MSDDIKTRPISPEYADNFDRIYGDRKPAKGGRWVWDAKQGKLVSADEYVPEPTAINANIMSGRVYENTVSQDGKDIGSRRKRKEYMKLMGVTDPSDYGPGYRDRLKRSKELAERKARRETIARAWYTRYKP